MPSSIESYEMRKLPWSVACGELGGKSATGYHRRDTQTKKGRARPSSFSDVRITTLESETLGSHRASMTELRAELSKTQEKFRRPEEDSLPSQGE